MGLVAFALVMAIALAAGDAGWLGNAMAGLFRALFGNGSWVVPIVAGGSGVALLLGSARSHRGQVLAGAGLFFVSWLVFLASPVPGSYLDPEAMASSGGLIGGLFAAGLGALFGNAKGVVVAAMGVAGLLLFLREPAHEIVRRWALARKQAAAIDPAPRRSKEMPIPKEAVVVREVPTTSTLPIPDEPERPAKKAPIVREISETVALKTEGEPKEGYNLPPLTLLDEPVARAKRSPQEMQKNIETLESTLEQFGIDSSVVEVATGPTITRYEIQLGPGIRVGRITALADNIAMNLAASHVRVEAPIPGKAAIGVEVPNKVRSMVTLREMFESLEFHDNKSKLMFALGKDVSGVNQYADLTRMPHLLIGGATNSGKSIALASLIMSLIVRNTPKDLRMVMIDPKRVELSLFEGLPHLMCPVVKDVKEAAGVLRAVWREMDRRYDKFSEAGVRNIDGWNAKASFQDRLSYIVVIIDELADLMIQCGAEVETSICRLAQLARATGIHLVIATQRPSVDVITGTIKANIASRMAFAVSSQIDSRTILDQAGAEKLIGRGDMLFLPIDVTKPTRIQGCYVSEREIEAVAEFWRLQEKPHYVLSPIQVAIDDAEATMRDEESDPLWEDAVRWVVERGQASTSMLQRRFSIGFQRASRLLDLMEERGIVGPRDGPRPREVLVDPMQVETLFGRHQYMSPVPDEEIADWSEGKVE